MQDEHRLYAHADNEFETEADEYPDEVEDGFDDDDEEEEEVSVIVATAVPVRIAYPTGECSLGAPAHEGSGQEESRGQDSLRQADRRQASGDPNRS